jgi:hypothetical protein
MTTQEIEEELCRIELQSAVVEYLLGNPDRAIEIYGNLVEKK